MSDTAPFPDPWYDTRRGFEKALKQGLGGLHEIADARRAAGYDRGERLGWWCVCTYFVFDECGNTQIITEGRPDYDTFQKYPPRVFSRDEWKATGSTKSMTTTFGRIPPVVETCPQCLEGWDIQNAHNYHFDSYDDNRSYHKNCWKLKIIEGHQKFWRELAADVSSDIVEIRAIPNGYMGDSRNDPWFIFETAKGPITVGRRKSVYSVSWRHSEIQKDGKELFKAEGVTTDRNLVHAWSRDKLVEYLKKLLE